MQSDSSTLYGDLIAEQPNDHRNNVDYSSSAASLSELYHPRHVMQQHQDMINHHNLCLTRLHEAAEVTEALRQENTALRSANRDLNKQLIALIQASKWNHFASSDHHNATPFDLVNELQGFCLSGGGSAAAGEEEVSDESSTSMMEGAGDVERVMLPKSISVRSNAYLKMMSTQTSGVTVSHRGKTRDPTQPGIASQLNGAKVYVQRGKRQEEPLELEVYNQGMLKTELCNKWQETGACLYGDHCQYAHGIEELRPIIRHPRYKTEVCRVILAGDVCPYGHRCHFRHALTEQEKSMGCLKPGPGKI
ncbi:CALLOSE DEFECTIVE MICROSPORE1 [Hibiscus trionum]|uniref:CALLOSE DEFECTIVE MICROSPORE1 n=1 Tax=Hibiscus trionum TaxID=183268 RepID=A0A9W7I571_HIBTR|nr:CALLOSE DEFECTIVE MICROSPORE1 [Hibiscus trionum]